MRSFRPTFSNWPTNPLSCSDVIRAMPRFILRRPAGFGLRELASIIGRLRFRKVMISSGFGSADMINTI